MASGDLKLESAVELEQPVADAAMEDVEEKVETKTVEEEKPAEDTEAAAMRVSELNLTRKVDKLMATEFSTAIEMAEGQKKDGQKNTGEPFNILCGWFHRYVGLIQNNASEEYVRDRREVIDGMAKEALSICSEHLKLFSATQQTNLMAIMEKAGNYTDGEVPENDFVAKKRVRETEDDVDGKRPKKERIAPTYDDAFTCCCRIFDTIQGVGGRESRDTHFNFIQQFLLACSREEFLEVGKVLLQPMTSGFQAAVSSGNLSDGQQKIIKKNLGVHGFDINLNAAPALSSRDVKGTFGASKGKSGKGSGKGAKGDLPRLGRGSGQGLGGGRAPTFGRVDAPRVGGPILHAPPIGAGSMQGGLGMNIRDTGRDSGRMNRREMSHEREMIRQEMNMRDQMRGNQGIGGLGASTSSPMEQELMAQLALQMIQQGGDFGGLGGLGGNRRF